MTNFNVLQLTTWTPVECDFTDISTSLANKPSEINLDDLGVATSAKEVLVYVEINNHNSNQTVDGRVGVYTKPEHTLYVYLHTYNGQAWGYSYNSDNLWLPIEKRTVTGIYVGKGITGTIKLRFRVIGYR